MIKTLAFIKRRVGIERDAFRAHYEDVHVPLALPILDGLVGYVRYHVRTVRFGFFDFDVMTAFAYRDKAATDAVFARLASDEGAAILEDELSFMDKPANRFFAVSERLLHPIEEGEAGDESDQRLFVVVSRPPGMSRFDACASLAKDHWPRLLSGADGLHFALLRDCFPMQGEALLYDAVLEIGADSLPGLESWSKSLEAEGFAVCALETQRYETLLVA